MTSRSTLISKCILPPKSMNPRLFSAALSFVFVPGMLGQSANAPRIAPQVARNIDARAAATDSIKAGNLPRAVLELRSGAKRGPAAMAEDAQLVGELCTVALSLSASQHPSAKDTAQLAMNEAAKLKSKVSRREAAYMDARLGAVMEIATGDAAKARDYYASALALDPTRKDAVAGLKRFAQLQALLRAKEDENAALRSRVK